MAESQLLKDDWPLLAGGVLVIFVIFYALRGKGTPNTHSVSYQTIGADPNVLAAESQQQAARYGAVTSIVNAALGLEATQSTNQTQLAAAEAGFSAQTQQATLGAEYQILHSADTLAGQTIQYNDALAASNVASSNQLSAIQAQAHASQQSSFWNSLFGGLGSVAKLIPGFSGGSGSGYTGPDMAASSFGSYA